MSKSRILLPLLTAVLLLPAGASGARGRSERVCQATTRALAKACRLETAEAARVARAICLNLSDADARDACAEEAHGATTEALEECAERREARGELCALPGFGGPYDPEIDPADFTAQIDNPFAPLAAGSKWVYEKDGAEGLERIEIEVTHDTREILGVACAVVLDRVWLDGELIEDTVDWVAQHANGDVWYFGEISRNFEGGLLANLDGSWQAGVDGAKPGIWIEAAPQEGDFYRQEWFPREAEDVVEVVDLDALEEVPFANGNPVLLTRDFTPLDPGVFEFKYYVPGVGLVLEIDPESGERLELIEFTP